MNHNIMEKISDKYIQQMIKEAEEQVYVYTFYDEELPTHNQYIEATIVRARDKKELYLQIFDHEINVLLSYFLTNFCHDDSIISKYLPLKSDIFSNYYYEKPEVYDEWIKTTHKDKEYIDQKIYEFMDLMVETYNYCNGQKLIIRKLRH